jgi:hypothetical protein
VLEDRTPQVRRKVDDALGPVREGLVAARPVPTGVELFSVFRYPFTDEPECPRGTLRESGMRHRGPGVVSEADCGRFRAGPSRLGVGFVPLSYLSPNGTLQEIRRLRAVVDGAHRSVMMAS